MHGTVHMCTFALHVLYLGGVGGGLRMGAENYIDDQTGHRHRRLSLLKDY